MPSHKSRSSSRAHHHDHVHLQSSYTCTEHANQPQSKIIHHPPNTCSVTSDHDPTGDHVVHPTSQTYKNRAGLDTGGVTSERKVVKTLKLSPHTSTDESCSNNSYYKPKPSRKLANQINFDSHDDQTISSLSSASSYSSSPDHHPFHGYDLSCMASSPVSSHHHYHPHAHGQEHVHPYSTHTHVHPHQYSHLHQIPHSHAYPHPHTHAHTHTHDHAHSRQHDPETFCTHSSNLCHGDPHPPLTVMTPYQTHPSEGYFAYNDTPCTFFDAMEQTPHKSYPPPAAEFTTKANYAKVGYGYGAAPIPHPEAQPENEQVTKDNSKPVAQNPIPDVVKVEGTCSTTSAKLPITPAPSRKISQCSNPGCNCGGKNSLQLEPGEIGTITDATTSGKKKRKHGHIEDSSSVTMVNEERDNRVTSCPMITPVNTSHAKLDGENDNGICRQGSNKFGVTPVHTGLSCGITRLLTSIGEGQYSGESPLSPLKRIRKERVSGDKFIDDAAHDSTIFDANLKNLSDGSKSWREKLRNCENGEKHALSGVKLLSENDSRRERNAPDVATATGGKLIEIPTEVVLFGDISGMKERMKRPKKLANSECTAIMIPRLREDDCKDQYRHRHSGVDRHGRSHYDDHCKRCSNDRYDDRYCRFSSPSESESNSDNSSNYKTFTKQRNNSNYRGRRKTVEGHDGTKPVAARNSSEDVNVGESSDALVIYTPQKDRKVKSNKQSTKSTAIARDRNGHRVRVVNKTHRDRDRVKSVSSLGLISKESESAMTVSSKSSLPETFLNLIVKGPDSERGYSMNKILKRWHRARWEKLKLSNRYSTSVLGRKNLGASTNHRPSSQMPLTDKAEDEKELWRKLRLRKNERGEIVLFY